MLTGLALILALAIAALFCFLWIRSEVEHADTHLELRAARQALDVAHSNLYDPPAVVPRGFIPPKKNAA